MVFRLTRYLYTRQFLTCDDRFTREHKNKDELLSISDMPKIDPQKSETLKRQNLTKLMKSARTAATPKISSNRAGAWVPPARGGKEWKFFKLVSLFFFLFFSFFVVSQHPYRWTLGRFSRLMCQTAHPKVRCLVYVKLYSGVQNPSKPITNSLPNDEFPVNSTRNDFWAIIITQKHTSDNLHKFAAKELRRGVVRPLAVEFHYALYQASMKNQHWMSDGLRYNVCKYWTLTGNSGQSSYCLRSVASANAWKQEKVVLKSRTTCKQFEIGEKIKDRQ